MEVKFTQNINGVLKKNDIGQKLDRQPEEFCEGELANINKGCVCDKKIKISPK